MSVPALCSVPLVCWPLLEIVSHDLDIVALHYTLQQGGINPSNLFFSKITQAKLTTSLHFYIYYGFNLSISINKS